MHAMVMAVVNAMTAAMANAMADAIVDVGWLCASYVAARSDIKFPAEPLRKERTMSTTGSMYEVTITSARHSENCGVAPSVMPRLCCRARKASYVGRSLLYSSSVCNKGQGSSAS